MQGFGYHHAGLVTDDRATVEALYLAGCIHVLATTSTLAHGINLPTYLVIIKGTNCWRGGGRGYEKLPKGEIIQMCGRAGRPGFDDKGRAVIMTDDKDRYSNISLSAELVESTLPEILTEALCTEVAATVIRSLDDALAWLKDTYFHVRVKKVLHLCHACTASLRLPYLLHRPRPTSQNPKKYGFESAATEKELQFIAQCLVTQAVDKLSEAKIVNYDISSHEVSPLPEAFIMTKSMIDFQTMKILMDCPNSSDINTLLLELSKSDSLHKPLRRDEKKVLNDASKQMRFPVKSKDRVKDAASKAYILMQIAVSRVHLSDFALRIEQSEICESAVRILSGEIFDAQPPSSPLPLANYVLSLSPTLTLVPAALFDYCLERGKGALLSAAVLLQRALTQRNWGDGWDSPFVQISNLASQTVRTLTEKRLQASDVAAMEESQIKDLLGCPSADAKEIFQLARAFNVASRRACLSVEKCDLVIDVLQSNSSSSSRPIPSSIQEKLPTCQIICYDTPSCALICHRKDVNCATDTSFSVPLLQYKLENITCLLIFSLSGIDNVQRPGDGAIQQSQLKFPQQAPETGPERKRKEKVQTTLKLKQVPQNAAPSKAPQSTLATPKSNSAAVKPTTLLNDFGQFSCYANGGSGSEVKSSGSGKLSQTIAAFSLSEPVRAKALEMTHGYQSPAGSSQVMHSNEAYKAYINSHTGATKTPTISQQNSVPGRTYPSQNMAEQHLNALRRKGSELHLDRMGSVKRLRGSASASAVHEESSKVPQSPPGPSFAFQQQQQPQQALQYQQHHVQQQEQRQQLNPAPFFDVQNFKRPDQYFFESVVESVQPVAPQPPRDKPVLKSHHFTFHMQQQQYDMPLGAMATQQTIFAPKPTETPVAPVSWTEAPRARPPLAPSALTPTANLQTDKLYDDGFF